MNAAASDNPLRTFCLYFRPAPGGAVLHIRTEAVTPLGARLAVWRELTRQHGGAVQLVDIREEVQP